MHVNIGEVQKSEKVVMYDEVREYADKRGIPVVEVCGWEGVNVQLAFITLLDKVWHYFMETGRKR